MNIEHLIRISEVLIESLSNAEQRCKQLESDIRYLKSINKSLLAEIVRISRELQKEEKK